MQLDDAMGAEDMLVQLTERNLMLGEVCPSREFLDFTDARPENRRDADNDRGS